MLRKVISLQSCHHDSARVESRLNIFLFAHPEMLRSRPEVEVAMNLVHMTKAPQVLQRSVASAPACSTIRLDGPPIRDLLPRV